MELESPLCLSSFLLKRRKRSQSLASQNLGFSLATTKELVFSLVLMLVTSWSKWTFRLASLDLCPHNQPSSPILAKYHSPRGLHWPVLPVLNQTCLASKLMRRSQQHPSHHFHYSITAQSLGSGSPKKVESDSNVPSRILVEVVCQ